jgi:cytochrome P450
MRRGIHFCLGQQLARVEAQVAGGPAHAHVLDLALAPGPIAWNEPLGLRGPMALATRPNGARVRLAA